MAHDGTRPERRVRRDVVTIVAERAPRATLSAGEVEKRLAGILGISVNVTLLDSGSLARTDGKGTRFFDMRDPSVLSPRVVRRAPCRGRSR